MDPVLFTAMIRELSSDVDGAHVNKIHQPSADEVVLRLWGGRGEKRLYIRARGGDSAIYLTQRRFANPFTPPRFCQLLRSRLSRLKTLSQFQADRVAVLDANDSTGVPCRLVIDLRNRPNLALLDNDDTIIDLLFRVPAEMMMPGAPYRWPSASYDDLRDPGFAFPADHGPDNLREWLLEKVSPMSPWLADEIRSTLLAGVSSGDVLQKVREYLAGESFTPQLESCGGKMSVRPFHLTSSAVPGVVYPTLSSACDALDGRFDHAQTSDGLSRTLGKIVKKIERRALRIEKDEASLDRESLLRHHGELLNAHRHLLRAGMHEVEVLDYTLDPPASLRIPLDPAKSPQENVDGKFRLARKLGRAAEHIERRRRETQDELSWLREMQFAFDDAGDDLERERLARELEAAGYLSLRSEPSSRSRAKVAEPVRRAVSPSGFELVWGKNPRGNDYVSCKLAQRDDLWFHVWQKPGCHLVLRRAGRPGEIPAEDIEYAASLAAGYSSARVDNQVEVMMALGKAVRKPKGARPGLVTVDPYETVRVSPLRLPEEPENG